MFITCHAKATKHCLSLDLRCKSVRIVVPALPEVIPGTLLKAAYSPGIRKTKGFPIEELLKLHPAVTANAAHTA
jgi:hypothetical protein